MTTLITFYLLGCAVMFALMVFPPTEHARVCAALVKAEFLGRRPWMYLLMLLVALCWPAALVWMLRDEEID